MIRKALPFLLLAAAVPLLAAPKPYHLQLEAYPAAPFPFFSKFGTVTVDVYSGGVHAESLWLTGFSRSGSPTVTVENPVMRMYTDVPLHDITSIVAELAGEPAPNGIPPVLPPVPGNVKGIPASRYRIQYGPTAWIDLWTTAAIPPNAQLRTMIDSVIAGISPPTAIAARAIPGTPVYVELNFRRFQKVPLVRLKKLTFTSDGESDALKVGSFYFRAPLLDSIWR